MLLRVDIKWLLLTLAPIFQIYAQDTSSVQLGIPVWADFHNEEEVVPLSHSFDLNVFVEYLPLSFSSYRNQLEDYNINILNSSEVFFGINFKYQFEKHCIGLDLGFAKYKDDYLDSLHLGVNGLMSALSYSYIIINREKWEFSPMISARWFRYRLMNSNINYDLSLSQYLEDRDLDLRFNQGIGFLGGKFNFKIPQPYEERLINVNIGIYGGYQFKLHPSTMLYSRRNQLDAGGGAIKYDGFFAGIYFGVRIS